MKTNQKEKALTFGEFIMAAHDAWGKRRARGIVCLAVNAHLVEFQGQRRFVFTKRRPNDIYEPMNSVLETPAHEDAMAGFHRDDVGVVRKANGSFSKQGRSELRWLNATVPSVETRGDDLEMTHWKKVWRSTAED